MNAFNLTAVVIISLVVGFPLVIWHIIRGTRDAPIARRVRRIVVACIVFWLVGVAYGAGLYMYIGLKFDNGPAAYRAMQACRTYVEKTYGPSSEWHSTARNVYTSADHQEGYYLVCYRSGARSGVLKASYSDYQTNKTFTFEDQPDRKAATP